MMHEHGKSDRCVVPTKPPNKGASESRQGPAREMPAEAVEGRRLAKSNPHHLFVGTKGDYKNGEFEKFRLVERQKKMEKHYAGYH